MGYVGVFSGGSLVSGSTESNLGSGVDISSWQEGPSVSHSWGSPPPGPSESRLVLGRAARMPVVPEV